MKDERSSRAGASGVSRRAFLQGSGAAAAATALATGGGVAAAADDKTKVLGPGPTSITLKVNGADRQVTVEPRTTLLDCLRDQLALTGAHAGCEHGVCGACTVLLDGEPVRSCLMFAVQADGAVIRTVEGLADGERLHPLQQAFWEHHGLQCGFCTPGFLMLATWLLERDDKLDLATLRHVLSSNLCRCTGYQNIIKAVTAAARTMGKWSDG